MERLRRLIPNFIYFVIGLLCFVAGLSMFTFVQAKGYSYISDDPLGCVNCHVMRDEYEAWQHSSHARVATCNDCHTPHDNVVNKYIAKGINGFNHSFAFTFDTYEEVITITEFNHEIVNNSCLHCHDDLVSTIAPIHDNAPDCITCHAGIGHPIRD